MDKRTKYIDKGNGRTLMRIQRRYGRLMDIYVDSEYVSQLKEHKWYVVEQRNKTISITNQDRKKLSNFLYQLQHPTYNVKDENIYVTIEQEQYEEGKRQQMNYCKGYLIEKKNHREYVHHSGGRSELRIYSDKEEYKKGEPSLRFYYDTEDTERLQGIGNLYKGRSEMFLRFQDNGQRKQMSLKRFLYYAPSTDEEYRHTEKNPHLICKDGNERNLQKNNLAPYPSSEKAPHKHKDWRDNLKKRYSSDYRNKLAEAPKKCKITDRLVEEIRAYGEEGYTTIEIAEKTGVKRQTVGDILYYRTRNPLLYKDNLREVESEKLKKHTYKIAFNVGSTLENIKEEKIRKRGIARYIIQDSPYEVDTITLGDYQYYIEVYHNGVFIGVAQFTYGTPYIHSIMENKNMRNIVVQKINADKYGYAKEQNTILTRELVYRLMNSINESL